MELDREAALSYSAFEFVGNPADDLKCLICSKVATEPDRHESCGKIFCRDCLVRNGKDEPCPSCKQEKPVFSLDKERETAILALSVKCMNRTEETSCGWKGTLAGLDAHFVICRFPFAFCPNGCKNKEGTGVMILRELLAKHMPDCPLRNAVCAHCGEMGAYSDITQAHLEACPAISSDCPNVGCTHEIQHGHVASHLETCEHAIVQCKYKNIGCKSRLERRDIAEHEEETYKDHLHLALDAIATLQDSKTNLEESHAQFIQTVAELHKSIRCVEAAITVVGESTGEKIRTIEEGMLKDLTKGDIGSFGLKDSFTFKVDDVEKKIDESSLFTSKPFYAHGSSGYHMVAKVQFGRPNIAIQVMAVCGRFDGELSWPFLGIISVRLLNQINDKNHHLKRLVIFPGHGITVGRASGTLKFISPEDLDLDLIEEKQFLLDDSLYFNVSVVEMEAWLNCSQSRFAP